MNKQPETGRHSKSVCSVIVRGSRRRESTLRQLVRTNWEDVNYRFLRALPFFPPLCTQPVEIAHEMLRGQMATKAGKQEDEPARRTQPVPPESEQRLSGPKRQQIRRADQKRGPCSFLFSFDYNTTLIWLCGTICGESVYRAGKWKNWWKRCRKAKGWRCLASVYSAI